MGGLPVASNTENQSTDSTENRNAWSSHRVINPVQMLRFSRFQMERKESHFLLIKNARQLNYVHELDKKGLVLSSICSFKMLSDNQIFLGKCR